MTMVSSGPISLGGNATSGGLNQSINIELGRAATDSINLNESAVRTLAGVSSGAISLSNFYGKSNEFAFTISTSQSNVNLRTAAVNAGWNQSSRLVCTISSGVTISSTSTGSYALTINGSFPGGVQLNNAGTILGRGGAGGTSDYALYSYNGRPGDSAGPALLVQSAVSINNTGRISGGGGGGGTTVGVFDSYYVGKTQMFQDYAGGGGGGGIGNGPGGGAALNSSAGTAGTLTAAGSGGLYTRINGQQGISASGGSYGSAGGSGTNPFGVSGPGCCTPGAGGAAGAAVVGNSNITWIAFGTRNGSIS